MADYIYLLEHRLSAAQQAALQAIRQIARAHGETVFLVGGAVRDLTSGSPVRDLDVAVQGNAFKWKKELELAGASIAGEMASAQALFLRFAGGVRVELASTVSVTYPKPGKPVVHPATIQEDLRRRDFTANAMALSLNDGSYGLLMDPLNGVADLENRQLRLVSNYGFIEDPVRMIRAARFAARLGWTMEEKTQGRYETGKAEKYIAAMGSTARGYETEEIFHEEDPLRVLRRLEEEGWLKHLSPALGVAKVNAAELEKLHEAQTQLQLSGIQPDAATSNFPLLTAKLSATELAELKKSFVRQGFVREIEALEGEAKEFGALLGGKNATLPSQAWKLIHGTAPEAVLWLAYASKSAALQAKLKSFQTEWPKARTRIPYPLMQEMRIVPGLEGFDDVVEKLFFELMDGRLGTVEETKAFLEVYSPPAPPPPVHLRRARATKKDAKGAKSRKKGSAVDEIVLDPEVELNGDEALDGGDGSLEDEAGTGLGAAVEDVLHLDEDEESDEVEERLPVAPRAVAALKVEAATSVEDVAPAEPMAGAATEQVPPRVAVVTEQPEAAQKPSAAKAAGKSATAPETKAVSKLEKATPTPEKAAPKPIVVTSAPVGRAVGSKQVAPAAAKSVPAKTTPAPKTAASKAVVPAKKATSKKH